MPSTREPKKPSAPKAKGAVRAKSGCYTCRIRRKKCDERSNQDGHCETCVHLRLECLGFGARRPEWLRESRNVSEMRDKIKGFLAAQGMIKGYAGSATRPSERAFLRLTPEDTTASSSEDPTPLLTPSLSPNEVPRMRFCESDLGQFSPTYNPEHDDDPASYRSVPHLPIKYLYPATVLSSCAECQRLTLPCDGVVPCGSCIRRGCASICPDGSLLSDKGNRFLSTEMNHLPELATRMHRVEHSSSHASPFSEEHEGYRFTAKVPVPYDKDDVGAFSTLPIGPSGGENYSGARANSLNIEEKQSGTFAIHSPKNQEHLDKRHASFDTEDLTYSQAHLGIGGCSLTIHESMEAASWVDDNWGHPLLTSIQNKCGGPFAWMLSPSEPALAIFGSFDDPIVVNMAESLAVLSAFPVVIRPSDGNPALTLLAHDAEPSNVPAQPGSFSTNNDEGRNNAHDGDEIMDVDETMPDISENGRRRDGDRGRRGSNEEDMLSEENEHKPQFYRDGQGDGGGDGGGGPSSIDSKWDSPLHRMRIKLRLKLASGHAYAVTFGHTSTFTINRETKMPIDLGDLTRPLSQPEVIALVDLKLESRPRETQVDRSYASIGFVAHRRESIIEREFLHRGFNVPDKVYKRGEHRQIQRGIKGSLGFSQGSPLATADFSYNRNNDVIWEATDNKVMPRCRVDYEPGDEWDVDDKSYSSYNIAYQRQVMQMNSEPESGPYSLEVKFGMGINLRPSGSKRPLPQISFVNRNQVLIWVSDPTSRARIRGIVVLMSSYLDNIRTEEELEIYEQQEIELSTGQLNMSQTKKDERKPGTISLSIAQVESQRASGSTRFGGGFIAKLGQRSSTPARPTFIPPHEYLARGWDVNNNEWRSVLWPALDKNSRAAVYERTPPVCSIECQWKQARHNCEGLQKK
ncbi:Transcriptional regulatory protein pro-1 [Mycena venus]|uniref:Transcriptional regulatory protein pro-1 n=1 Tax=Mycena venus TaxID=2733690 RepID=A0A8H6Y1N9_9AGAR|nr:Transcriptional regulatory protein pro-1 [Mycena venus]